jgi:sulfofructose kinase
VAAILIDREGERLVVPYYDAALDPDPSWLPLAEIAGFDGVLVDVRWPPGAGAVLDAARRAGRIAMLDGDIAPAETLDDLVPRASHVVFSEPGLAGWTSVAGAEAGLRAARLRHPGFLAVTLGPEGAMWLEGDALGRAPAPRIDAIDTLAAGDVFHGAFLLALAERRPVAEAARFACVAAALKCRAFGSRTTTPGRAEVEAALAAS